MPTPPPAPSTARGILVTRDSVCMADDIDAPHAGRIEIDPNADALGVADAILAAGYLPAVAGGSTWSVRLGDPFAPPRADLGSFEYQAIMREADTLDQLVTENSNALCIEILPDVVTYITRGSIDRHGRSAEETGDYRQRELYGDDTKPRRRR